MIPKSEKLTDEYQLFLIDEVYWYPYFSAIVTVLGVTVVLIAIFTSEIIWLVALPVVIIALCVGRLVVENKWRNYKAKVKEPAPMPDDKREYWKCDCGKMNPVGIGICQCGKNASESQQIIEE